jgi:hypothetical protein
MRERADLQVLSSEQSPSHVRFPLLKFNMFVGIFGKPNKFVFATE